MILPLLIRFAKKNVITSRLRALYSDYIDITGDGKVSKRIIRIGNANKGKVFPRDSVDIDWKIYDSNSNIVHTSDVLDEKFRFVYGIEPREVIKGWEIAVGTMYEGEIAELIINSEYAFGVKGLPNLDSNLPPLIAPNSTIKCELQLIEIIPSVLRTYKSMGANESIKEELLEQIESANSVFSDEVRANKATNETENRIDSDRRFFDPTKDKLDPNRRVYGEGDGHVWEESITSIDVEIPLKDPLRKSDIIVDIKKQQISIKKITGEVIFEGILAGSIVPSSSMWAILEPDPYARVLGHRITLSLEKGYDSRDLWATFLSHEYLEVKNEKQQK